MILSVIKYNLAGMVIALIGALFYGDALNFAVHSVPARLTVAAVEQRSGPDQAQHGARHNLVYRPVFALETSGSRGATYKSNIWTSPPLHRAGDVVPGRYDATSGEMRSDKMMGQSYWLGGFAIVLGLLTALQSIALLCGIPEGVLPIRVRLGSQPPSQPVWRRSA